ncbi:hypothetical protein PF008_g7079 [Phytophthora fragariae]|uniref:Uncharacterized protein n=1 Tax=Phytophthora fragariae TaxID=53985 RepID=A0A6G0S3I4_9STRA|nr:hypothetical protein PF008_g7079 [Phytophthora fragariae]
MLRDESWVKQNAAGRIKKTLGFMLLVWVIEVGTADAAAAKQAEQMWRKLTSNCSCNSYNVCSNFMSFLVRQ